MFAATGPRKMILEVGKFYETRPHQIIVYFCGKEQLVQGLSSYSLDLKIIPHMIIGRGTVIFKNIRKLTEIILNSDMIYMK
jgi:hypothetical protein